MTKTFIVADIGVNHNGSYTEAARLIRAAAKIEVDAVKFQAWQYSTFPKLAEFHILPETLYELASHYEQSHQIKWFVTPFDIDTAHFFRNQKIWKIPSNKAVWKNEQLIDLILEYSAGKELIVSSGIQSVQEILEFTKRVPQGTNLTILHCVSKYPTKPQHADLERITTLRENIPYEIGFSDHSGLPEMSVAAVVLGARIIECHITRNKKQVGPDHKSSLEPDEFADMIRMVRNVEKGL